MAQNVKREEYYSRSSSVCSDRIEKVLSSRMSLDSKVGVIREDDVVRPIRLTRVKKRKRVGFFHRLISFVILIFIGVYVLPYTFKKVTEPLFLSFNKNSQIKGDVKGFLNRTNKYISNEYFLGERMLMSANLKTSQMQTLFLNSRISELENSLYSLIKSYPMLKPSIFMWDYQTNDYVDICGNEIYPTASIIKLPILVELFRSIEKGKLDLDNKMLFTEYFRTEGSGSLQFKRANTLYDLDYLARIMITESDNSATNMIMSAIGGKVELNRALRRWGLEKTYIQNWLPDLKGENVSTAKELATILYNLDNASFLSLSSREKIIDYMSHVKNDRLLAAGIGKDALIAHKTGDIGTMLGDAGIIYLPNGKRYIVVILSKRPFNSPSGKEFIVRACRMIYDYMYKL